MIVDDHEAMRLLLRALIENAGGGLFVSGEAASGEEALERVAGLDPAVVLLDDSMPGLDGVRTAARIRALRPGQAIVLCSGSVDAELELRARAAGIAACVGKDEVNRVPQALRDAVGRGS